ncbi:MAG: hypothetical protein EOP49_10265, partial [Sphingobacteriales bacterium]
MKLSTRVLCCLIAFFISYGSYSQANPTFGNCPQDFEGTAFAPAGWAVLDNGVGLTRSWEITTAVVGEGTKSAIILRENIGAGNTSEDWLATPRITVPVNGELQFLTRKTGGDQGTLFNIMISTDPVQANRSSYVLAQQYTWATLTTDLTFQERRVDLSSYAGQQVYIAFVRVKTQNTVGVEGSNWAIDVPRVVAKCPEIIAGVSASNIGENSAQITWSGSGSPQVELEYGPSGFVQGTGTVVTSTGSPFNLTGLTAGTLYQVCIRPVCNSCGVYKGNWSTRFNFLTLPENYCSQPSNLTSVQNGNTATLSWVETGGATSWRIAVEPYSAQPAPATTTVITTTSSN